MNKRKSLFSIGLSIGTIALISVMEMLPYGSTLSYWMWLPGLLVASIAYPEGIHSGGGGVAALVAPTAANLIIYTIAWFSLLSLRNWRA